MHWAWHSYFGKGNGMETIHDEGVREGKWGYRRKRGATCIRCIVNLIARPIWNTIFFTRQVIPVLGLWDVLRKEKSVVMLRLAHPTPNKISNAAHYHQQPLIDRKLLSISSRQLSTTHFFSLIRSWWPPSMLLLPTSHVACPTEPTSNYCSSFFTKTTHTSMHHRLPRWRK